MFREPLDLCQQAQEPWASHILQTEQPTYVPAKLYWRKIKYRFKYHWLNLLCFNTTLFDTAIFIHESQLCVLQMKDLIKCLCIIYVYAVVMLRVDREEGYSRVLKMKSLETATMAREAEIGK